VLAILIHIDAVYQRFSFEYNFSMKIYGQSGLAEFLKVSLITVNRQQRTDWKDLPRKKVNIKAPGTNRVHLFTEYDTIEVIKWLEKTFN